MTSFPLLEIEKGQEFWEKEGSSGEKYKGGWLLQEKRKIVSSDAEKFLASVCTRTLVNTFFPFSRTQPGYYIHPVMCGSNDDIWNSFFSTPLEPANLQFTGHIQAKRLFSITN